VTLRPLELALNEKQIPQFVENNRNASRKWKTLKELSCLQSRCFAEYRTQPILIRFNVMESFTAKVRAGDRHQGNRQISGSRRQFLGALLVHYNLQMRQCDCN
jgi:hypothetical protein